MKAARALLRWEQKTLSDASRVSLSTIKRLEGQLGKLTAHQPTIDAITRSIEAAGVEFIAENGGGAGVRLRKPTSTSAELDGRIGELDAKAKALDVDGAPSPRKALNQLKKAKALGESERGKLEGARRPRKKPNSP